MMSLSELKTLEGKTLTKERAVKIFGTETQKAVQQEKGKLGANQYAALEKTMKQYFDKVSKVKDRKDKRKTNYRLGKLLHEDGQKVAREDYRSSDKLKDYAKSVDIFVLSMLMDDEGEFNGKTLTMNSWMEQFDLISSEYLKDLRVILNSPDFETFEGDEQTQDALRIIKKLQKNEVIPEDKRFSENKIMLNEYFREGSLRSKFTDSLKRMERAGIIKTLVTYKAKVKDSNEYITFTEDQFSYTIKGIVAIKEKLQKQGKREDGEEFRRLREEFFETIPDENGNPIAIEYYFETTTIVISATRRKVMTFLKKYNKSALADFISSPYNVWANEKEVLLKEKAKSLENFANKKSDYQINKIEESDEDKDLAKSKIEEYRIMYLLAFKKLEDYYSADILQKLLGKSLN